MKKVLILILVLISLLMIVKNFVMPDYIRVNRIDVQRCYNDMIKNPILICD